MEQTFSQRMGFKPIKSVIQVDSMDDDLRIALWNAFGQEICSNFSRYFEVIDPWDRDFIVRLWVDILKRTYDTLPNTTPDVLSYMKNYFFTVEWYEVYDFIEFVAISFYKGKTKGAFIERCNKSLEQELSAYRFVGMRITPVTSTKEIEAIEKALTASSFYTQHLEKALDLLSNKTAPDYRNSIKEAVSAVEATCQLITGNKKTTLGSALKRIESKIGPLHAAQKDAFDKIYGYTSDADGIRHALLGESNLDVEDAMYMLIVCSAFINYLVSKAEKAGINLSPSM